MKRYLAVLVAVAMLCAMAFSACAESTGKDKLEQAVEGLEQKVDEKLTEAAEAGYEASEEAPAEGEQEAPAEGEQEAPAEGEQEAPAEGEQEAPAEGEQEAPAEGEQEAPAEGEQEAPAESEQEAPAEGEQEAPAEGEQEAPAEPSVHIENGDCFIRKAPSTKGKIVGIAFNGDTLPYTGEKAAHNWLKVKFGNGTAWVSGVYAKVNQ